MKYWLIFLILGSLQVQAETKNLEIKSVRLEQSIVLDFYFGGKNDDEYLKNSFAFVGRRNPGELLSEKPETVSCEVKLIKTADKDENEDPFEIPAGTVFKVEKAEQGEVWDWGYLTYAHISLLDEQDADLSVSIHCEDKGFFKLTWDVETLSDFLKGIVTLNKK
jgi:hypothetical protein